jgi:uncharacterized protein YciI
VNVALRHVAIASLLLAPALAWAQPMPEAAKPAFDADLAKSLGADDLGMRRYVLVILKSGPKQMAAGAERDAMFRGHFANIQRLAGEGKLAVAGPFMGGAEGWRGLYVFAVKEVEEAKALTATDPVIVNQEMVAEYHPWYGTAALLQVNDVHQRIAKKQP